MGSALANLAEVDVVLVEHLEQGHEVVNVHLPRAFLRKPVLLKQLHDPILHAPLIHHLLRVCAGICAYV